MKRPTGITITAALMASAILAGIVHSFVTPLPSLHSVAALNPTLFLLARILPYAFAAFECACVWGYWTGVEWARILVLIDCVLVILALRTLPATFHRSPSMAVLEVGKVCLAIFLFWYLFRHQVRAWFKGSSTGKSPDAPDTPAQHSQPTI